MSEHMRPEGNTSLAPCEEEVFSLDNCVHCGLCLDACTTYRVHGQEQESPRGRIALMRARDEGRLSDAQIGGPLSRCVGCNACESACPSQVPYHKLLQRHRERVGPAPSTRRLLRGIGGRTSLRLLGFGGRLARRSGLLRLAAALPSARLRAMAAAVPGRPRRHRPAAGTRLAAREPQRGSVALHLGCVQPEFLGGVVEDAMALLRQQGFEVVVPEQPPCCGALHAHDGATWEGTERAHATRDALAAAGCDSAVVPSAGCAAHLRSVDPQAAIDEILLFLHRHGLRGEARPLALRAAYDPPCHLQHVLGARDEVQQLLATVPDLQLVAHDAPEVCCGAGGVSFLRAAEQGAATAAAKATALLAAEAQLVLSGNPGCMLQLEGGLRAAGSGIEVLHPLSLLRRAYAPAD